ncbi:MAG TPA: (2Fe-2S) ferredoxin domain-containing protein [Candidatus Krumholzibacteria bacterium]|nr:(2Fe-2S) ferredoxin domain-containing protein [Candidatus Krumholzibacteria bacterium]
MMKFPVPFAAVVFVCTNKRPDGHPKPCCADRGGLALRDELKDMVREAGLDGKVKVFQSGCLGACEQGPIALRYPDGQLMMGVKKDDLPSILNETVGK